MPHEFVIEKDGQILTFDDYDQIPKQFDLLIKFLPELLPCDHDNHDNSDHKHEHLEYWHSRLIELLENSHARSSQNW